MKKHGRYKLDHKPVVAFCSAKTALELKDVMPVDMAVNTLIATTLVVDDTCVIIPVHDFKKFLNKHGKIMKRKGDLKNEEWMQNT